MKTRLDYSPHVPGLGTPEVEQGMTAGCLHGEVVQEDPLGKEGLDLAVEAIQAPKDSLSSLWAIQSPAEDVPNVSEFD